MTIEQIPGLRLSSQHLLSPFTGSASGLLEYLGAMQAQDYAMVKMAIGLRLQNSTLSSVSEAFSRGEILRTHVLRPTWHVVAAGNIRWMIDLTAPRLKTSLDTRHKELGLTSALIQRCLSILETELSGKRHLTREEIVKRFNNDGIDTSGNRSSHIMMLAELEKLVCSGGDKNGKPTYALLEERVPAQPGISKEEALAKLTLTYFTSHGPATLQDFAWWAGQNQGDAGIGLEQVKNQLTSQSIGNQLYWMKPGLQDSPALDKELILLPAYDEYIISYKEREMVIPAGKMAHAVSSNGIFWPVILQGGLATGTWSRKELKDTVLIKPTCFFEATGALRQKIVQKAEFLGRYLEKEVQVEF